MSFELFSLYYIPYLRPGLIKKQIIIFKLTVGPFETHFHEQISDFFLAFWGCSCEPDWETFSDWEF